MKKRITLTAAIILICAAVFSSCKSDDNIVPSETSSTQTTRIYETDYTYNDSYIYQTEQETAIRTTIAPPSRTKKQTETAKASETASQISTKAQTYSNSGHDIEEIHNGITVITKTSPVSRGNSASIIIYGTAEKTYSIEFYENGGNFVKTDELADKKADENGFASWTFKISETCESGNKKIIVREKNSDKFVQTSITVQ